MLEHATLIAKWLTVDRNVLACRESWILRYSQVTFSLAVHDKKIDNISMLRSL